MYNCMFFIIKWEIRNWNKCLIWKEEWMYYVKYLHADYPTQVFAHV